LAEEGAVEVGVDGDLLEDGLAEDGSEEDQQFGRKLLVDVLIPLEFVHDVISLAQLEDASELVEHLLDDQVHPLPQQPARVVDLVAHKLDLDLLVHVDLLGLGETGHQDVVFVDFHDVRPTGPVDAEALEVVPEPC